MEVTLVLIRESGPSNAVRLRRARLVIGRKPECEIRIPVPQVSREHAEVTLDDGTLAIKDLGSSNGTYVDGQRVQQSPLVAGSVITIGPATFVVQVDGQPANIDVPAALKKGAIDAAVAAPVAASRPASPNRPTPVPKSTVKPAPPGAKPGAKQKDPDDSDFDLDDSDESSFGNIDFSDLLKDDDEDEKQPKL